MEDGQKASLREDTVLYHVYPLVETSECTLVSQAVAYNTDVLRICGPDHIWYYEPLRLKEKPDCELPCLTGQTCFCECVDDEWFIVGVLLELTKLHPHIVISIEDNDGQFLLIEAAHHLPKWLKPETAENRVFLYQGAVHIVGYPVTPSDVGVFPTGVPTISQSLKCVRSSPSRTLSSTEIQRTISKRIERSQPKFHSAHCLVPIPAAHVLTNNRRLLSSIIHAFCDRDKEEMKVIRELKNFSPRDNEMVVISVKFPRLLYAKIRHEQWNVPTMYGSTISGHQHKTALLGMKLTCGLELLSRCYSKGVAIVSQGVSGWSKFLSSLHDRGYFRGELEGSQLYRQLLSRAEQYYTTVVKNDMDGVSVFEEAGCIVAEMLASKGWNKVEYANTTTPPDDDSWLYLSPNDLDSIMDQHSHEPGSQTKSKADSHTTTGDSLGLEEVAYGMKSFIDKVSSIDGAEFPWSSDASKDISFDPESFLTSLETMIDKLGTDRSYDNSSVTSDDSLIDEDEELEGVVEGEEADDEDMVTIMEQLNQELSTFSNLSDQSGGGVMGVADKDPVDIDCNLVTNLLESYSEQVGGAGPASNIMSTMGINFPKKAN